MTTSKQLWGRRCALDRALNPLRERFPDVLFSTRRESVGHCRLWLMVAKWPTGTAQVALTKDDMEADGYIDCFFCYADELWNMVKAAKAAEGSE